MSNGYVHTLIDEKLDFKQFMLRVANMGSMKSISDVREQVKVDNYYLESCSEAIEEYNILLNMSLDEKITHGQKHLDQLIKVFEKTIEDHKNKITIVKEMYNKVQNWIPPTKNHIKQKEYVLELFKYEVEDNNDYFITELNKYKNMLPLDIYDQDLAEAKRSTEYTKESMEKAIQNNNERIQWCEAFIESLENCTNRV